MRKLKISARLVLLVVVQVVVLAVIGALGVVSLNRSSDALEQSARDAHELEELVGISDIVRGDVSDTIYALDADIVDWATGKARLDKAKEALDAEFAAASASGEGSNSDQLGASLVSNINEIFARVTPLVEAREGGILSLFVTNELPDLAAPVFAELSAQVETANERATAGVAAGLAANEKLLLYLTVLIVAGVVIAVLLGVAVFRSIAGPMGDLSETVQQIREGDETVRANLEGNDEMAQLGGAFDELLDDRLKQLRQAEEQNEELNNSVIGLLGAVAQLSQKDLRVRVPVTEDVTGPVADALNLMTDETALVLSNVRGVADEVAMTSRRVKSQADSVVAVSNEERAKVEQTAAELGQASQTMREIAEMAQLCSRAADLATETTQTAQTSVSDTVGGITSIRDTIRETEKRIKRLGERSQEITAAVSLINSIAERTHILALNASMHAASAGEAGRGFAVVADEVQRLAENAREATQQISGLVQNIQVETADTVSTMNDAISQVVEGTQLAESAGAKMRDTRERTNELVELVQRITQESSRQAELTSALVDRAQEIVQSNELTNKQLGEQSLSTDQLVSFSDRLVQAVGVFQLPAERTGSGDASTSTMHETSSARAA